MTTRFLQSGWGRALNVSTIERLEIHSKPNEHGGHRSYAKVETRDGVVTVDPFNDDDFYRLFSEIVPAARGSTVLVLSWLEAETDYAAMVLAREFYVLAWRVENDGAVQPIVGESLLSADTWLLPMPGGGWLAPDDCDYSSREAAIEAFRRRNEKRETAT